MSRIRPKRHPVEAVVTTLPFMMLLIGVVLFYRGEMAESAGRPVIAESIRFAGTFDGLSVVPSGGDGRHYFWFTTPADDRSRGPRVTAAQAALLRRLSPGDRVVVHIAPHVAGSGTYWAWRVEQGGEVLFDDTDAEPLSARPAPASIHG